MMGKEWTERHLVAALLMLETPALLEPVTLL